MRQGRANRVKKIQQAQAILEIFFNRLGLPFAHMVVYIHNQLCKSFIDGGYKLKTL
jgi:translation initiation factor 2 alpha subunit (eIF-2alpha)